MSRDSTAELQCGVWDGECHVATPQEWMHTLNNHFIGLDLKMCDWADRILPIGLIVAEMMVDPDERAILYVNMILSQNRVRGYWMLRKLVRELPVDLIQFEVDVEDENSLYFIEKWGFECIRAADKYGFALYGEDISNLKGLS